MINQLKSVRDNYLKKLCNYYRKYKDSKSENFYNTYYMLWDKFMSLNEVIYIFEDYPYSYNIFLSFNENPTTVNYNEYEAVYDHCTKLLYTKMGVYFK